MWSRTLAATMLGLPATAGLIGLIVLLWPGDLAIHTLPWLLLAFPVWMGAMSLAFSVRTSTRAWLWLGGSTALCFGLIHLARLLGWAAELPR